MKLIERKEYMEFLKRHKDKNIIKVVSGVRRCGKSKLFELFQNDLLKQGVPKENIISIILKTWLLRSCRNIMLFISMLPRICSQLE